MSDEETAIGIDLGVKTLVTTSDGIKHDKTTKTPSMISLMNILILNKNLGHLSYIGA